MKVLKWIGGIILALVALLFLIPFAFNGKVKDFALEQANQMLESDVYLGDVSISLFRDFPDASISLNDFGVAGRDTFAGDTLVSAEKLRVVVDIASLLSDNYNIKKITLENANLHAKVLADGRANWNIVKEDTSATTEVDTTASAPLKLSLKRVSLKNVNVKYDDYQSNAFGEVNKIFLYLRADMSQDSLTVANVEELDLDVDKIAYSDSSINANINNFAFDFSGDVSDAKAKLISKLGIDKVNLAMANIPYLSDVKVAANIDVDADLANNKYVLGDNNIAINDIKANMSGFVQMIDTTAIDMDVKLNTPALQFKDILSLIPAVYKNDFASLETDGKVALDAWAKGRMEGDNLPAFDAKLKVENARVKYPALPKQIENINIDAEASSKGGVADNVEVNVPNFSLVMAGNPFQASLNLKTPISDPDFKAAVKGVVDFNSIKDVVPLTGINLAGKLNADANAEGRLSYVEKEQYDKFAFAGTLDVQDVRINGDSVGIDLNMPLANVVFSNQAVALNACKINIGKNDFSINGKLENFLPYVMSDGTVKGNLNVSSNHINVNDFLGESEPVDENAETLPEQQADGVEIPDHIDFNLNLNVAQLLFDKIEISDIKSTVGVQNRVAAIKNFTCNTMDGSLAMNGSYSTQDVSKPTADFNMKISKMSIPKVFSQVQTANRFAPALKNTEGKFDMNIQLNTLMDHTMAPVLNTVNAKGLFATDDVEVKNSEVFKQIATAVKYEDFKQPKFKDLKVNFVIKDGKLTADPFETVLSRSILNVAGFSTLAQELDYDFTISLPNSLSEKTNIPLKFNVNLLGTFTNPKLKVDMISTAEAVKEVVKEKVTAVVNEAREKAIAKAKATQQKLMAEAKTQGEKLVAEATKAGDKLVAEAETQGQNMVSQSKNPIEKKAKQKLAEKLVSEAKQKRSKLIDEANKKSINIQTEAQAKSDKLIKEAEATK